ncbi:uncharacterized protein J8A68_002199 [[Candida] subhashii]|uniref:L domain-like protein n=1 Tax=[Candida] subhashii TaxID=561895 RepID=A0A8J5QMK6_9ASCO|nr:uncharacterized protein J8A68_002199 [[Candida] subhashii]KAG7664284.1 hypothetical protein J8A68_002199 [[Candida] subhashii]
MSDEILTKLSILPPEVTQIIVDYIPDHSQKFLLEIPFFRKYVLPKLFAKVIVERDGLDKIEDPFVSEDKECADYTPIAEEYDMKTIISFPNSISLIASIEKFQIFPKFIQFNNHFAFFEVLQKSPIMIEKAENIKIRMIRINHVVHRREDSWWSLINRISSLPYNITILELFAVPIDSVSFSPNLKELIYMGKIRDKKRVFESLVNITRLTLREIQINQDDLEALPDNLEYLNMFDLKINEEKLSLPKNLREFVVSISVEYSFEYREFSISMTDLLQLERFEVNCEEFKTLSNIKLPMSIQELVLNKCNNLFQLDGLEKYCNLRKLEWIGALLSPGFYLLNTFPENLESLIIDCDNLKNSEIIGVLVRSMPRHFFRTFGMFTFRIGKEFKLPKSLKTLSIKNCTYIQINCQELQLPPNLQSLTLSNLAGFVGSLENLKLPQSISFLDFRSMNIEFVDQVTFPIRLRGLLLDDNRLKRLGSTNLHQLEYFRSLNLTGNSFKSSDSFSSSLPSSMTLIRLCDGLNELNILPCNRMKTLDIPTSINRSSKLRLNDHLESLWIEHEFEFDDPGFRLPSRLRKINAFNLPRLQIDQTNWLENLPSNLQILRLVGNQNNEGQITENMKLVIFPNSLRLISLVNLNLSNENFHKFDFSKCDKLTTLEISTGLTPQIDLNTLPNSLIYLRLDHLKIRRFIGSFYRFPKLRELSLSFNRLTNYLQTNDFVVPHSIEAIHLRHSKVKSFKNWNVMDCNKLVNVDLSRNYYLDPTQIAVIAKELNKVSADFDGILVSDIIMNEELKVMQKNSPIRFNFQVGKNQTNEYSLIYSCVSGKTDIANESDYSDEEM